MKLKYKELKIRLRDGACIPTIAVPAWEVPVLEALHEQVEVVGDFIVDVPAPSSAGEFERLKAKYGIERDEQGSPTGVTYVESVYGRRVAGQQALLREMKMAVMPADTPVTPPREEPQIRSDLLSDILSDTTAERVSDLIGAEATA